MYLYDVIKKHIETEKSVGLEMSNKTYVVEVSSNATKVDIKKAFKQIYGVDVRNVGIVNVRAKFKQGRKGKLVKRRESKKAYVTLADKNSKVDFSLIK